MFLEQRQPRHDLIKSRSPVSLDPVSIVEFSRTINTEPDKKTVLFEKAAPVIGEEGTVGLNGVADLFAPGILFLKRHYRSKIVDTQQYGLSALPGKLDFRCVLARYVLSDEAFKHFRRHPEWGRTAVEVFLFRVKAIRALQVARCPGRFSHHLKMHALSIAPRV